jgi:hypothetical protein
MKKVIKTLIFLCFFLIVPMLKAQVTVGFRVGANVAYLEYQEPHSFGNNSTLLTIGIPMEVRIDRLFSIQTALVFIQKAVPDKPSNWLGTHLLSKVKLGCDGVASAYFLVGSNIDINLCNKVECEINTVSPFDIGLNIGGQLFLDNLVFDVHYQHGLTNLNTSKDWRSQQPIYSRGFAFSVGFVINLTKKG